MFSAGSPKPEKLLYSALYLQTDSNFTVLNCHKWDRLGVWCFRLGRLGCRVIPPGENNITACKKDIWQQLCRTSAVKSLKLGWLNTVFSFFLYPWKLLYTCISWKLFESEIRDCKINSLWYGCEVRHVLFCAIGNKLISLYWSTFEFLIDYHILSACYKCETSAFI